MTAESTIPTVGPGYQAARRRRAELLQSVQRFEQAVAAPVRDPAWPERVRQRLGALRDQLAEHVVVTEGPDGLYAELLAHAPRLDRPVAGLVADHAELQLLADGLAGALGGPGPCPEPARVRQRSGELLAALWAHRQRGADLVYEAYETDIGGET
jgi:hypothetical protein